MAVILGTDGYRYEVQDNWAKLPPGMEFNADVAAVGVDANDNVYAFNRGDIGVECHARRQLRPAIVDLVAVTIGAQDDRHGVSLQQ